MINTMYPKVMQINLYRAWRKLSLKYLRHTNQRLPILNFIKSNPNIKWGDDGKIVYKDNVLTSSNITTLVGDIIRFRKPRSEGKDLNLFLSTLETEGYPISGLPRQANKWGPKHGDNLQRELSKSKIPLPQRKKSHKKSNKALSMNKVSSVWDIGGKTAATKRARSTILSKWRSI